MSADLILLLVSAGSAVLTSIAHRRGWLATPPVSPTPAPAPPPGVPTPTPANGQADQPALDFLTWLIAVKSGTVKLDDYDREVLKQIASAMPENGSPANPVIDDIVSRILAKLTAGKAAAPA